MERVAQRAIHLPPARKLATAGTCIVTYTVRACIVRYRTGDERIPSLPLLYFVAPFALFFLGARAWERRGYGGHHNGYLLAAHDATA